MQWGSLAEWLGAIGSVGAVGAALVLGWVDRRRARDREREAVAAAHRAKVELVVTALGAIQNVQAASVVWADLVAAAKKGGVVLFQKVGLPDHLRHARDAYLDATTHALAIIADLRRMPTDSAFVRAFLVNAERALQPPNEEAAVLAEVWERHLQSQRKAFAETSTLAETVLGP